MKLLQTSLNEVYFLNSSVILKYKQQPLKRKVHTMITLVHNTKSYEVKSISAAWNKIREIRDTTPAEEINETILEVDMGDLPISNRLPLEILFRVNTNGKVEFKDLSKVIARAEPIHVMTVCERK